MGSMILDAEAGFIRIRSGHPVYRRYVLAEELLAVGIAQGNVGSATIDSGGELVEMGQLAELVVEVIRPGARIVRDEMKAVKPDAYHSDGEDWISRCSRMGFESESLARQIEITARGLLARDL